MEKSQCCDNIFNSAVASQIMTCEVVSVCATASLAPSRTVLHQ